ncbi:MAG: glycosyl hydrolase-related protein [Candidatus Hydrogenedentes bacterium]|nr:glycosyl hydrolase-related protein [Candidatus Hydrogenedentota bacterium]
MTGHRASMFYNQPLGQAREKVERWIKENPKKSNGLVLWGVGDHGGGPSRLDMERLAQLKMECNEFNILHSEPEHYFRDLRASGVELPRFENEINPWGPGCYTSQVRIKQKHRLLENTLYQCEKMASSATIQGLMRYPKDELDEALRDLLVAEFHDILPGSSVQPVEDNGLRLMDHGQELLTRVRARAFFALAGGQPKPKQGAIPNLVFNPHPFPVRTVVECEFQLPDFQWGEQFTVPIVHQNGVRIASQCEQELGNLNLDWRKRPVFVADLAPFQMNRFDCTLEVLPERPKPALRAVDGRLAFHTDELEVDINCATGWIDRFVANGTSFLKEGAFKLLVIADNEDPWETRDQSFRNVVGVFELMERGEGTRFSGVSQTILESVRVIEDGEVRTIVEALFRYENSFVILHYKLPKHGTEVEVALRVHWNEKSKMLKLAVPTLLKAPQYLGQVAYGVQSFPTTGRECVAQKWTAVVSDEDERALTCINAGTYGSDFANGELRISLLRGPAYAAHPIADRPLVRQDRYSPRIDQGERLFKFWFNTGGKAERMESVDREALVLNERPFALSFNPSGTGEAPKPMVLIEDEVVQLTALKQAEQSEDYILRLFEPTGTARTFKLTFPALDFTQEIKLGPFEIKTFKLNPGARTLVETDLLER